jgi:hypothetical protein
MVKIQTPISPNFEVQRVIIRLIQQQFFDRIRDAYRPE